MTRASCAIAGLALLFAGCGGDGGGDGEPGPRIDLIDDAIAAVEDHYGAPQDYFEIGAAIDGVNVIVAVDGATAAEEGAYGADGRFTVPEPVGPASGSTFRAGAIDVDPDRIFDDLRADLDDPEIVHLDVQGGPDGSVVYIATVQSTSGGVLLVLLSPDGGVLGVQAS